MRRLWFAYCLAALGGCSSTVDVCAGGGTLCIEARVEGNVGMLDQLRFILVSDPAKLTTSTQQTGSASFALPVRVGIALPPNTGLPATVAVDGLLGGTLLAHDEKQIAVINGRGMVTFTLNSGTAPPDMTVTADMAMPIDMAKPPITILTSGSTNGYELEEMNFAITGNDPAMEPVNLSLMNVPNGAMNGQADGGTQSQFVRWTPEFNQAGMHMINVTATAMEAVRTVMQPVTVMVLNAVDPIFPGPGDAVNVSKIPATNIIGDFDGDGFVDVAACSVMTNTYRVTIVFGSAGGLPTMGPPPMAVTKQYTFNAIATADNPRLHCAGADFNNDGFSDVVIADPASGQAMMKGMIYVMFGAMRSVNAPVILPALDPTTVTTNERLGDGPILIGHFDGDAFFDFVANSGPNSATDDVFIFPGKVLPSPAPGFFTTPTRKSQTPVTGCGRRILLGMGDIDKDLKDEILVYNEGIGSTPDCNTTVVGGFDIIDDTADSRYTKPSMGAQPGFGGAVGAGALCDVDLDGAADLIIADGQSDGFAWIWFSKGTATGTFPVSIADVLDHNVGSVVKIAAPATRAYSLSRCVRRFRSGQAQTLLIADIGNQNDKPARVDLVSSSRTPMVTGSLLNPLRPNDIGFGSILAGFGDVNGDGANDQVVGSTGTASAQGKFWVVYGR